MASLLVVLLLVVTARQLAAQCDGTIVSSIVVVPQDPSFLHVPAPLRAIARGVGLEHTTTKADVIRRFLLFEVGQPCSATALQESQRILHVQPFLASATIRAVPDSAGGVRIEIATVDEIPTVFSLRLQQWRPTALLVGNGNVGGRALYVAARLDRGFHYRTGAGLQVTAYQAFGRPYTLDVVAYRAPLGRTVTVALGHAFLTALQRTAWHVGISNVHSYTSFGRPDSGTISLGVVRRFADLGSVVRIGVGRRTAFLGGLLTYEHVTPATQAVIITDTALVADTIESIGGPFAGYQHLRLNAVVGVRTLSFLEVRGFDALTGVQYVARGVQVGAVVGRGNDAFVSGDLYAGLGSRRSFVGLRATAEARYDPGTRRWDGMVASGRVAWYVKPAAAHLVIVSHEASGGWRMRLPFALALGSQPGGVRGYQHSRIAGAVRSVTRLEGRWALGRLTKYAGVGLAGFTDAGMVWAGQAPFGVNSGLQVGVGAGVLIAVPAQSRRLWRLDFAVPTGPDAHAHWELRLTGVWAAGFGTEPRGVKQARAGAAPSLIFTWP